MPKALLRINPEQTHFEIDAPEDGDNSYGPDPIPESKTFILADPANLKHSYLLTFGAIEGLRPDAVYRLEEVKTEVEREAVLDFDDTEQVDAAHADDAQE